MTEGFWKTLIWIVVGFVVYFMVQGLFNNLPIPQWAIDILWTGAVFLTIAGVLVGKFKADKDKCFMGAAIATAFVTLLIAWGTIVKASSGTTMGLGPGFDKIAGWLTGGLDTMADGTASQLPWRQRVLPWMLALFGLGATVALLRKKGVKHGAISFATTVAFLTITWVFGIVPKPVQAKIGAIADDAMPADSIAAGQPTSWQYFAIAGGDTLVKLPYMVKGGKLWAGCYEFYYQPTDPQAKGTARIITNFPPTHLVGLPPPRRTANKEETIPLVSDGSILIHGTDTETPVWIRADREGGILMIRCVGNWYAWGLSQGCQHKKR